MKISVLVYVLVLMLMVQRCSSGILAGIAAATGTVIAGGSATGAAKIIIGKCFVSNRFTVKPVLSDNSKRSPKIGFQNQLSLNAGQKYCRMLQESILQYVRPSLTYHLSLRPLFCLILCGHLRQVLLYILTNTTKRRAWHVQLAKF